jgi:hypothetical protein
MSRRPDPRNRGRPPDKKVTAPKGRHQRSYANKTIDAQDDSGWWNETARPQPHNRANCSTCVTYCLLTDRRRRMEIESLRSGRRICDLGAA